MHFSMVAGVARVVITRLVKAAFQTELMAD